MNAAWLTLAVIGAGLGCVQAGAPAAGTVRLSRTTDTYYMEDDLVYTRLLWFQPGGAYHQINRDRTTAEEVDRGTWEQAADGEVALHPTDGMLTPRAVSGGPLLAVLDTQARIDAVPGLRRAIASFLASSKDDVFSRNALGEIGSGTAPVEPPADEDAAHITLPQAQDSFSRSDLDELLRGLELWFRCRSSNTYGFEPLAEPPAPPLLIQQGAVFSSARVPEVRAAYHAAPTTAPPFYFARIDRRTFLARAGAWKPFANLAGTHAPTDEGRPALPASKKHP